MFLQSIMRSTSPMFTQSMSIHIILCDTPEMWLSLARRELVLKSMPVQVSKLKYNVLSHNTKEKYATSTSVYLKYNKIFSRLVFLGYKF